MSRFGGPRGMFAFFAAAALAGAAACSGGGDGGATGPTNQSAPAIVSVAGTDDACFGTFFGFMVKVTVSNPTRDAVSYTIPRGAAFCPDQKSVQNLMVIQDFVVSVAPGSSTFCVPVFCLDAHLDAPGSGHTFQVCSRPDSGCLDEIMDLVAGKRLDTAAWLVIQQAVWECREEGSISDDTRDLLRALPQA